MQIKGMEKPKLRLIVGILAAALVVCVVGIFLLNHRAAGNELPPPEGFSEDVLCDYPLGEASIALPVAYLPVTVEEDGTQYVMLETEYVLLIATATPAPKKISLFDMEREALDAYVAELAAESETMDAADYADVVFLGGLPYVRLVYKGDAETRLAYQTLLNGTAYTIAGSGTEQELTEEETDFINAVAASLHFDRDE